MAKPKRKRKVITDFSTEDEYKVVMQNKMQDLLNFCNKKLGDSYSVILASELVEEGDIEPFKTNHISFDCMTGIGGLPVGKIIEFTGEEGSHKSNFAWECVGEAHAENDYNYVVWIDGEKAIDLRVPMQRKHIMNMHVDFNRLIIVVPDSAEQCWSIIDEACYNNARLIVIDSVSSLVPNKEIKAGVEADGYPALPASINRGFRGISKNLWMSGSTLVEINQVREDVGNTVNKQYISTEDRWKTTGGKGLKHWLTLRLFFRKKKIKQEIRDSDGKTIRIHIGDEVIVRVMKTRLAPIMDEAHMFMYHKTGFDKVEELIEMLQSWDLLYKRTPRAKKLLFSSYEESLGEMTHDEWHEYFENEESYTWACEIMTEVYNNYYSENEGLENDIIEQEGEEGMYEYDEIEEDE